MNTSLGKHFFARKPEVVARDLLGKILVRQVRGQLGSMLLAGRIVETEAYLATGDPACHASRGMTRKNSTMFERAGLVYVYAIHARHCLNVVTEREGKPSAVLIRAIEPLVGLASMAQHRGIDLPGADAGESRNSERGQFLTPDRAPQFPLKLLRDLARGPGRLCQALAIDRSLDKHDLLLGSQLWITESLESLVSLASPLCANSPLAPRVTSAVRARHAPNARHSATNCAFARSPRIGVTSAQDMLLRYYLRDSLFLSGTHKFNRTEWE
ncbi:DNA-3-methyladenine glycosylase [Pirellula staleyi DSM 6068]|uniref:Putative 3-methyladenine DNA glycosylase n=1 Tax=Pirellula staleyi (strain ATCC 27377 / DSM 6068 / ICPB 4128) TaxID=530564 RepID=D2R4B8_PIRSD|nr:DNA-3-methyladenine glycosylase [Pirellula staleyi]ADB15266.1 DNA-3-methyladenine glycosylase [Pirellula staleyi DSM 6068]